MEERLDRIEKLLLSFINNGNNSEEKCTEYITFKGGVLYSMKQYIDKYYVLNRKGRVDTTQFNRDLKEALKNDGYDIEIKNIPSLMIYAFGFKKIKSDHWYYEGLSPKENITTLIIPKSGK